MASKTAQAGAYATFDTTRNRVVKVRVGVSFVSVARGPAQPAGRGPLLRLRSGRGGGGRAAGTGCWRRIGVRGGNRHNLRTFYTALYHALLAPRTFDDADGRYTGMDGQVHDAGHHTQFADFSGWDIYRSQIQLLSILAPGRAADIVHSMLADAEQSGCLPRWSYANGQSMMMVGDPADPIIASAAAFGASGFDPRMPPLRRC